MTFGATQLSVCQRALADIGTRSTVTSVAPPDGSQEAFYCNLYYNNVRDHILRAANWNFSKLTLQLALWKALPGTPENPTAATISGWSTSYPAPPWTYSYFYPGDCLRARALIGQPQQVPMAPPIFSGSAGTNPPISQRLPMARFEIATDTYDPIGQSLSGTYGIETVTIVSPGVGYQFGDYVTLAAGPAGMPASLFIQAAPGGVVTAAIVSYPGTYTNAPTGTVSQASTFRPSLAGPGPGAGLTVNVGSTALNNPAQTVVLTNQEFPLLEYTVATAEATWDAMFEDTMVSALAARLAQVLTGDKALARDKITIANANIQNARGVDGNEGLTINDHMPDWIRVRGVGGALGYEAFFYPLGPLFPVAPLV
jgi:hypothetical protein